jgi:antitoxin (DNA-binding transcriptional repressor) of toxin-antitoxin stability system
MKSTLSEMRKNPGKIIEAIERNEMVTLYSRGREVASIIPRTQAKEPLSLASSPAFGMWKDRTDLDNPAEYVRRQRRGRFGGS